MKKFTDIKKINENENTLALGARNPNDNPNNDNPFTEVETKISLNELPNISNDCVKLFSKLFESREMAHIYHLQVNGEQGSHAAHTALNDYYDSVLELIDDLIETYQGQYGIVDGYDIIDTNTTRTKDKVEYFEELVEFVKHARKAITLEDTHLHSIVDNIVVLIYRTLYKLKFTK